MGEERLLGSGHGGGGVEYLPAELGRCLRGLLSRWFNGKEWGGEDYGGSHEGERGRGSGVTTG